MFTLVHKLIRASSIRTPSISFSISLFIYLPIYSRFIHVSLGFSLSFPSIFLLSPFLLLCSFFPHFLTLRFHLPFSLRSTFSPSPSLFHLSHLSLASPLPCPSSHPPFPFFLTLPSFPFPPFLFPFLPPFLTLFLSPSRAHMLLSECPANIVNGENRWFTAQLLRTPYVNYKVHRVIPRKGRAAGSQCLSCDEGVRKKKKSVR